MHWGGAGEDRQVSAWKDAGGGMCSRMQGAEFGAGRCLSPAHGATTFKPLWASPKGRDCSLPCSNAGR